MVDAVKFNFVLLYQPILKKSMHVYHQYYNKKTLHQSCQGSQQPAKLNSQQFKRQSHDGEESTNKEKPHSKEEIIINHCLRIRPYRELDCSPARKDTEESH